MQNKGSLIPLFFFLGSFGQLLEQDMLRHMHNMLDWHLELSRQLLCSFQRDLERLHVAFLAFLV